MDLRHLINEWGDAIYVIAFLWAFFEGETFVLFGGAAAARGMLDPWVLGLAVTAGSFCGDQCWFFIGRRYGNRLLERFPAWRQRVEAPLGWLTKYDRWFILTYRFIWGIRNISSFALGLSPVPRHRFMTFNLLGSLIWAASFVAGGYVFGGLLGLAVSDLAQDLGLGLLGFFLIAIALGRMLRHRERRGRKLVTADCTDRNRADTEPR